MGMHSNETYERARVREVWEEGEGVARSNLMRVCGRVYVRVLHVNVRACACACVCILGTCERERLRCTYTHIYINVHMEGDLLDEVIRRLRWD